MSKLKRKGVTGAENLALNVDSDAETELYWDSNWSEEAVNLPSEEFYSDTDANALRIASPLSVKVQRVCIAVVK